MSSPNGEALLITGANGFVGLSLCLAALLRGFRVKGATRNVAHLDAGVENVVVGQVDESTNWDKVLQGVNVVIHLAARVHVMHDRAASPLAEFRRVNTAGTEHLARSAAASGAKRFVYVSSIKVNGEGVANDYAYRETDAPAPQDPYGISKCEAEQALHRVAAETGLDIVIVRPPLVYGAGVKGNFAQMMRILDRGLPLPLGSILNQRSLVYLGNLVDALLLCATHPQAAGRTYLVSDGEDVSTPDLLRKLGDAMECPARLFPCPTGLLKLAGTMVAKVDQVERLTGSLRVDSGKIRRELGWTPPFSMEDGLRETARGYLEQQERQR